MHVLAMKVHVAVYKHAPRNGGEMLIIRQVPNCTADTGEMVRTHRHRTDPEVLFVHRFSLSHTVSVRIGTTLTTGT